MDIRMVATDLDGTLLSSDKTISERNQAALKRLEEEGIFAVLASGRKSQAVRNLAISLGLRSPIISSNGARVDLSPDGPILMEDRFTREMAKVIYDILKARGLYFVIYQKDGAYLVNTHVEDYKKQGRGVSSIKKYPGMEPYHYSEDERLAETEGIDEPYKFIAFSKDPEEINAVKRELMEATHASLSSSWSDNVEILAPGAGKGKAIRALANHFGFSVDQVMAFGDYTNDLEMLKTVGVPVAMGNAADELKAVARHIAKTNNESGVGRVIEELIFSEVD